MRSALAGIDSNVVAVKIATAVPMSVIKRMFHFLIGIRNSDRPEFLEPISKLLVAVDPI